MPLRFALAIGLGCLALLALLAAAAGLLLPACALPLIGPQGACPPQQTSRTAAALASADQQRTTLERRIFELERELAARHCTALPPAPPDPAAPLTPEGWASGDLAMLQGCWSLDTRYRTRDVDTGVIRHYDHWQMCFDARGNGTQTMRASDGMECSGPVTAGFNGAQLSLIEPGNLPCADGGYIHQRQITCTAAAAGRASCATEQPETGGRATVTFARPPG